MYKIVTPSWEKIAQRFLANVPFIKSPYIHSTMKPFFATISLLAFVSTVTQAIPIEKADSLNSEFSTRNNPWDAPAPGKSLPGTKRNNPWDAPVQGGGSSKAGIKRNDPWDAPTPGKP
ncbi:hypothetical protein BG004_008368 [Podila humilis]|nr:hypothetical protein BG004_008368 [Podila humilis]